jgi:putative glycosyltransferase (TIGR04372 family)
MKRIFYFFFKILIIIKVFFFKNFHKNILNKYDFICVPNEISYGAPINILDFVRIKSNIYKKTYLIILSSSNNYLPFVEMIFKKNNYLIFNSKLIDLFSKLFCLFLGDEFKAWVYIRLQLELFKFNNFNYFSSCNLTRDKNIQYLDKHSDNFKKAYKYIKENDNKYNSIEELYFLRNKYGYLKFQHCKNYSYQHFLNLKKLFSIDQDYICLHVRQEKVTKEFVQHRNSKVKTYNLLINFLIKKNFKVILLGEKLNSKYKKILKHKNVIHYYKSQHQNIINDCYLIFFCKFYVGNFSGNLAIPRLFGKPSLILDCFPLAAITYQKNNIYYPKIVKKNYKKLSIKNILDSSYFFLEHNIIEKNITTISLSSRGKLLEIENFYKCFSKNKYYNRKSNIHKNFKKYISPVHGHLFNGYVNLSKNYLKQYL